MNTQNTKPRQTKSRRVYLLHIIEKSGRVSHYVGMTNDDRQHERIGEHKRDKRNHRLYSRASQAHAIFWQALEHEATAGLERFYQCASEETIASEICERCRATRHITNEQTHLAAKDGLK